MQRVAFRLQKPKSMKSGELVGISARSMLVITTLFTVVVFASGASLGSSQNRAAALEIEELLAPIEETPIDLHGNEVRPAIARYKIDPAGALYEEHSPGTELPKLAPPKS